MAVNGQRFISCAKDFAVYIARMEYHALAFFAELVYHALLQS